MCQAQGGVAGDGAASIEDFGDAACVVPGGLRIHIDAFPTVETVGFLMPRPRRWGTLFELSHR
jgi:hypothetical protein